MVGEALMVKLKEDMIGKRVVVFNYGHGKDPVKVMVKEDK